MKLRIARKVVRLAHEKRHRKVTVNKAFARVNNQEKILWIRREAFRAVSGYVKPRKKAAGLLRYIRLDFVLSDS